MSRSLRTSCFPAELPGFTAGTNNSGKKPAFGCFSGCWCTQHQRQGFTSKAPSWLVRPTSSRLLNRLDDTNTCTKPPADLTNRLHPLSYPIHSSLPISSDKASCYPSAACPCNHGNTSHRPGLAVVTLIIIITATIV